MTETGLKESDCIKKYGKKNWEKMKKELEGVTIRMEDKEPFFYSCDLSRAYKVAILLEDIKDWD